MGYQNAVPRGEDFKSTILKPLHLLNVAGSRPLKTCMLVDDSPEKVYAPSSCEGKHKTELFNYINLVAWRGENENDTELRRISTELFPKLQQADNVRTVLKPYERMDAVIKYVEDSSQYRDEI